MAALHRVEERRLEALREGNRRRALREALLWLTHAAQQPHNANVNRCACFAACQRTSQQKGKAADSCCAAAPRRHRQQVRLLGSLLMIGFLNTSVAQRVGAAPACMRGTAGDPTVTLPRSVSQPQQGDFKQSAACLCSSVCSSAAVLGVAAESKVAGHCRRPQLGLTHSAWTQGAKSRQVQ